MRLRPSGLDFELKYDGWRALAYVEAGADGIFIPGVTDEQTIADLQEEIRKLELGS